MNKKYVTSALIAVMILVATVLPNVAAQDDAPPVAAGRPLLGVAFTISEEGFPQITRVYAGTPAAEAGLLVDDIITAIDGNSVEGEDLAALVAAYVPGDTITLTVMRGAEEMAFAVTLAEFAPVRPEIQGMRLQVMAHTFLGIAVEASEDGITIRDVVEESPAEAAGLLEGDLLVALNGESVTEVAALRESVQALRPGDTVTVTVLRDEEEMDFEVTLAERASQPYSFRFESPDFHMQLSMAPFVGVGLEMGEDGIIVTEVVPDSPAEAAGLQEGDRIVSLNGEEATDAENLIDAIRQLAVGDTVTLGIQRDGEVLDIEITLGDWPGRILRGNFGNSLRSDNDIQYLPDEGAWEINALDEGSALTEAGLQAGDRITAVDGESFTHDRDESPGFMHTFMLGGEATLTVERDGEALEIEVPAGALTELMVGAMPMGLMMDGLMPSEGFRGIIPVPPMGEGRVAPDNRQPQERQRNRPVWLGVRYLMLDEQMAQSRDLPVSVGALLLEVEPLSPAAVAGLQAGDIVEAINGEVVDARRVLARRLNAYAPGDTITLDVLRDAESMQIEVILESVPQSG